MWMTRAEISEYLGIVPNSVRGKVKKGQIERKVIDGKNLYRILDEGLTAGRPVSPEPVAAEPKIEPQIQPEIRVDEPKVTERRDKVTFNPKETLLEMLASMKVGRSIDAIEKGDEIDLATNEISRELDARITMRQARQIKEIEEALERIKHGEYGECEDCGEPIPEQRLKLFPAARLCVRCQEEADRYERMKDDHRLRSGAWRDDSGDGGYGRAFDD